MTGAQANGLLALMCANYPRTTIGEDTTGLWLDELEKLDREVGEKAVRSLIAGARFWPSIADLNEHVQIVRRQQEQAYRAEMRRAAEELYEQLERPPLRSIPAVAEYMERHQLAMPDRLERVDDGPCDDCRGTGPRCRIGRVLVCRRCARSRLAAGAVADADPRENGEVA